MSCMVRFELPFTLGGVVESRGLIDGLFLSKLSEFISSLSLGRSSLRSLC